MGSRPSDGWGRRHNPVGSEKSRRAWCIYGSAYQIRSFSRNNTLVGGHAMTENASADYKIDASEQAEDRQDFMKRFFAVAISIGFASQLDETFKWATHFDLPNLTQFGTVCMMVCAVVVSIGSWEAYFKSLRKTPLNDWPRFYSDIAAVSLYVLLFKSVTDFNAFRLYFILIYLNYIVWNIFSIRINPNKYNVQDKNALTVIKLFLVGFSTMGSHAQVRGPFIIFFWFLVISISIALHELLGTPIFWAAVMLAASHITYRMDLAAVWPMHKRLGRSAAVIGCVVVGTLAARVLFPNH